MYKKDNIHFLYKYNFQQNVTHACQFLHNISLCMLTVKLLARLEKLVCLNLVPVLISLKMWYV